MAKDEKKSKKDKSGKKGKEAKSSKEKAAPAKAAKKSSGDYRSFTGSIALSKLICVGMTKKNKKGKKVKGLFIPIKENFLTEGKDGAVYLNIRLRTTEDQDQYENNGFISHSADSSAYKAAKEKDDDKALDKMKNLPILGNVKDWESTGSANDTSGKAGDLDDEDDDLPF